MARRASTGLAAVAVCFAMAGCGDAQDKRGEIAPSTLPSAATETTYPSEGDAGEGDGYWADDYTGPEMPLVYHRVTEAGSELWVRLGPAGSSSMLFPSGWTPPAWCYPAGRARLAFVDGATVGEKYFNYFAGVKDDALVEVGHGGYADGHPMQIYPVQVRPGIVAVELTSSAGLVDRAAVDNGWAVVVFPGEYDDSIVISVIDDAGVSTPATDYNGESTPVWSADCTEPAYTLPSPGEQPGDPAAADAALRARFGELWAGDMQAVERFDEYIDDSTGLAEVTEKVLTGPYADVVATVQRIIYEVVFVPPTESWLSYKLTSFRIVQTFFGHAELVDGEWVFARAMVCQEVALTGTQCRPAVSTPLIPPQG